ncbi:unnamed protein product [Oikopleura dioica]|uniref:Uncharacterized protein n=1 Tax=Oikopleura dioica TaxID=34765 RepID=E4XCC9_OIKDI|nr:unnamed protein product [Oikopleura dioica]
MEGHAPQEGAQKSENPYLDSDFDFGKENAFMLNEIQSDIAFNLNKIQQKYIYTKMAKMYRCMADCEETESNVREIPRCQAQCAENFVTPARKIIETEVDRVNNMINFELDECIQTARGTVYADSFKEEKREAVNNEYMFCNKIALSAFSSLVKGGKFLEKVGNRLEAETRRDAKIAKSTKKRR